LGFDLLGFLVLARRPQRCYFLSDQRIEIKRQGRGLGRTLLSQNEFSNIHDCEFLDGLYKSVTLQDLRLPRLELRFLPFRQRPQLSADQLYRRQILDYSNALPQALTALLIMSGLGSYKVPSLFPWSITTSTNDELIPSDWAMRLIS